MRNCEDEKTIQQSNNDFEFKFNYKLIGLRNDSISSTIEEIKEINLDIEKFQNSGAFASKRKFIQYSYDSNIIDFFDDYTKLRYRIDTALLFPTLEFLKDSSNISLLKTLENDLGSMYSDITLFIDNLNAWMKNRLQFYSSIDEFFKKHTEIDTVENRKSLLGLKSKLSLTIQMKDVLLSLGDDTGIVDYIVSSGFSDIYACLINERVFKKVCVNEFDAQGQSITTNIVCNDSNITKLMKFEEDHIRRRSLKLNYEPFKKNTNTYASILHGHVSHSIMLKNVHGFDNPYSVYTEMLGFKPKQYTRILNTIEKYLELGHSYIKSCRSFFCDDRCVENHDIKHFLPGKDINDLINNKTHTEHIENIKSALFPLGDDYKLTLEKLIGESRIDIGQVGDASRNSGCMCFESPIVGPTVFVSFLNSWCDVSNCSHEIGHMMNNYYSMMNKSIKAPNVVTIPVFAEMVATLNEFIIAGSPKRIFNGNINDLSLDEWKSTNDRIKWILFYTLIRQSLISEFEFKIYTLCDEGNVLNSEDLSVLYENLIEKYFGPDYKMIENERYVWATIDHYFSNQRLYTAAYVISTIVAYGVYLQLINPETHSETLKKYMRLISAGSKATLDVTLRRLNINIRSATETAIRTLGSK